VNPSHAASAEDTDTKLSHDNVFLLLATDPAYGTNFATPERGMLTRAAKN
jgi:hypothetical protein